MAKKIDTLLLCALPASGKSEVRRYMASLPPESVENDLHMGPTTQLDDYPYVHLMRRISEEMVERGMDGAYFRSSDQPFTDPRDWGTLIHLVNEDYRDLHEHPDLDISPAAPWLFARMDAARTSAGAPPVFSALDEATRAALADAVEEDAAQLLADKRAEIPSSLDGRTIVIEFARGGAEGASLPLDPPFGYAHSFACLSDEILQRASVLYVWVTPEDSRRKNDERAKPGREGDASILHHGVPEAVMRGDYGTDDMGHLIETSEKPGTVTVQAHGQTYHLPVARFDNRDDLTSFLRGEPSEWPAESVAAIHQGLGDALASLARD